MRSLLYTKKTLEILRYSYFVCSSKTKGFSLLIPVPVVVWPLKMLRLNANCYPKVRFIQTFKEPYFWKRPKKFDWKIPWDVTWRPLEYPGLGLGNTWRPWDVNVSEQHNMSYFWVQCTLKLCTKYFTTYPGEKGLILSAK